MTRMKLFSHVFLFWVITFAAAFAQSPGEAIDAKNAEQDERIAEREAVDAAQGAAIIELREADAAFDARLDAVEKALENRPPPPDPDPPVEPEPEPGPEDPRTWKIQTSTWVGAPSNIEEPYINIVHGSETRWSCGALDTAALYAGGYISRRTGLPDALPPGCTLTSNVYFTVPHNSGLMPHWDGDWILECDSEGEVELGLLYFPASRFHKTGPCRYEFTRDAESGATPYHAAIQVRRADAPVTGLRLFRAGNESALRAGKLYNPAFIAALSGYDILRLMDSQEANRANIRTIDQLATMDAAHWSNIEWLSEHNLEQPFLGMPLEAAFRFCVEAAVECWMHAPITIGAPMGGFHPDIYDASLARWLDNVSDMADENDDAILGSPEWDRYAEAFADALIRSGYPPRRTLYVTVSNEVWNFAGHYNYTSRYAGGLGDNVSDGYGRALARFKLAVDAALARAGRAQDIFYVIERQAASPGTSQEALEGVKDFLEDHGAVWLSHAPAFGLSVASYWGSHDFRQLNIDPNDLDALEDWHLDGPERHTATLNWILARFRQHADIAARFGVKFIGAYEGGSHFTKPSEMTRDNFVAFNWGERGGRVNAAVNEALAAEFPGVILSNYALCGAPHGQPWFEGPCGADTPMNESWKRFLKP